MGIWMFSSDILRVERRRRWQDDEKLAVLSRVGVAGRSVADVAREADVTRQHIYQWRQEMRRKGLWPQASGALFIPVEGDMAPPCADSASDHMKTDAIEITLRNGRILRCTIGIDPGALARLIHVVEAA